MDSQQVRRNYPIKNKSDILLIGYEEWENLGLRSIAAFLNKHNIKVKILPCDKIPKENILTIILRDKPKIVGFSLIFQRMLFEFADLITYLRDNKVTAHFTMGGHFPSIESKVALKTIQGLDSVIRGEGEQTLQELFLNIDKPDSWNQIKGLSYWRDRVVKLTLPRPLIQNLDDLPYPIRADQVVTHRGLGLCSILASRGCYYNCSFCSIHQFYSGSPGPKRRSRSPVNVVREMEQLFYDRGIRIFIFEDDDFVMKTPLCRQWIRDFVEELKKKKIADHILWRVSCRIDDLDSRLIKKMKDVGLLSIYIGIESGNEEGLRTYNKHYMVDDIYKRLTILQDLKIPFEFGFMIFNPYSTFDSVKKDIVFLKEIGKSGQAIVHFTKMVPYAGTAINQRLKKDGRLKGTIASPDYTYQDSRLELLQMFFTRAFHFRNFDNNGLVERLRHAKFDAVVLSKFFSNRYDTDRYSKGIQDLIRQSNEVCLEKMSLAVNFMENRDENEIFDNWQFLETLVQEEKNMERMITNSLDCLMNYNS
jgi:radical SAM superfamily enzyme YgiQ (UPF0313 family)